MIVDLSGSLKLNHCFEAAIMCSTAPQGVTFMYHTLDLEELHTQWQSFAADLMQR